MKKQTGFTLLELMLVFAVMAVLAGTQTQQMIRDMSQSKALDAGVEIYQHSIAVQRWLAYNPGISGVRTGTLWLKDASCGGSASQAFLPCSFSNTVSLGNMAYSTTISTNGGSTSATTQLSPLIVGGLIRPDLSGLVALAASGGAKNQILSPLPTSSLRFGSDPDTAKITTIVSNSEMDDAWLRTDGSNTMDNNLVFSDSLPSGRRLIRNIASAYNRAGEALVLGNGAINSIVVMNADTEVMQNLLVRGNILANQTITAGGSAYAGVNIQAARDLNVGRNATALGTTSSSNLSVATIGAVGGSFTANNNVNVGLTATAGDAIVTQNASIAANTYSNLLTATNNSSLNMVQLSGRIYDMQNGSYYLDPNSYTRLNRVDSNSVMLRSVFPVGGGCGPSGLLARKASGELINCVSGVWRETKVKNLLLGVLYYNLSEPGFVRSVSSWGLSNSSACSAGGGAWILAFTSRRYTNAQGTDYSYFCISI